MQRKDDPTDRLPPPDPLPFPLPRHPRRYSPDRHLARGRSAGRGKGEGEDPVYTPYIVLNDDDPVTPAGVFYLSPDIWVTSSLGMNLPVEGEANQIFARVHNRGLMDAANVNVTFFWADPSAAITDNTVNPIGGDRLAATAKGVFIPAVLQPGGDSVAIVPCPVPWFPAPLAHECLVVKAWCPGIDPSAPPWEPALDPVNSRHTAQHNVTVKLLPPGQSFKVTVGIANPSSIGQLVRAQLWLLPFPQVAARLKTLAVPLKDGLMPTERRLPMEAWLNDDRQFIHEGNTAFAEALIAAETAPEPARAATGGRKLLVTEISAEIAPWERRTVTIAGTLPHDARPGEAFGFELVEYLGELVTGGFAGLIVATRR